MYTQQDGEGQEWWRTSQLESVVYFNLSTEYDFRILDLLKKLIVWILDLYST